MTNMRHKSVDAKRRRNGRYKAAIAPIREMFGCTAAEAGQLVLNELTRNNKLQAENEALKSEIETLKNEVDNLKEKIENLKTKLS